MATPAASPLARHNPGSGLARPSLGARPNLMTTPPQGMGARTRQLVRIAEVTRPTIPANPGNPTIEEPSIVPFDQMSYSEQFEVLYQKPLNAKVAVPKPSKEAQTQEPEGKNVLLSDVVATPKRPILRRKWSTTDLLYGGFVGLMHVGCLFAPATFSWPMVGLCMGMYFITGCLGITLSYHRQISHKSFKTPKWLEYALAYCGVLAAQGDPIDWASSHRYHHMHTDTPLDPHSPYEGFWWSHMGWFLDSKATEERVGARANKADLESQPFYRFLEKTYALHIAAMFGVLYALGGFPAVIWGGAVRLVIVYHITWFVNSASHCWGTQAYNTGDLSRNNWWVGLLAWGEGWHNNHHAFESSARHGLEWWQVDVTWGVICLLEKLGLATNVKLPSKKRMEQLAL